MRADFRTDAENAKKQALLDLMKDIPLQTLQIAFVYARNFTEYGEDVTKTWVTAMQQSEALEKASELGYYEGLRRADETISKLQADRDRLATALDDITIEVKALFPPVMNWRYGEGNEHEQTVCKVLNDVLQILDDNRKVE